MMKNKENKRTQKLNKATFKEGVLPLLGVALVVFVMTVAVYFVADYVASSYPSENTLSGWNYLYTEKAGAVPEGELRIFNSQNPILTESAVKKSNLYLTKTIEPENTGKTLVLVTDYSPVKIRLNGKDIYDNQFKTEEYVGNCYNAIYLEPSTHDQQIDVFMKLPFSVRFEAYLKSGGDPAFDFSLGFYFGAGLLAAGLIAMAVFGVLSIVKRRFYRSILISGLGAYIGLAIVMHLLPESTYLLNLPIWLRLSEIPVQMTFLITLAFLNRMFKKHIKSGIAIGLAALISIGLMMLSFTALMVKISSIVMCVLCLAAALFVAQLALAQLERRTQYATPVFVMCVFYALMILFAGILLINRFRVMYIYTAAVSTFVVGCVLEYTYIHDYRFAQKNSGFREQSVRYGNSVDLISVFIRNMLSCSDQDAFYHTVVTELSELLTKYNSENADVDYCIAVKENGAYNEVISKGVTGCQYRVIEDNFLKNDKNYIFSETYFEYVLKNGDDIGCIIHFENIKNGLDTFFISMLEATFCGLETTYENMFVQSDKRDINIIFEELAENAELDNGCSVEHLENICKYTRELCLRLGFDKEKAEHIATASKLHDLGKIAVPKHIIEKQGRLSEEEQIIIGSHTDFGYTILSAFADDPLISTAAVIARYHHEHYDGTGKNALKGEDIPIEARIVTVCDVFDALVSERSYKKAWTKEAASEYIAEQTGKLFDPKISEAFIEYLKEE